jgi:hypothetical protein
MKTMSLVLAAGLGLSGGLLAFHDAAAQARGGGGDGPPGRPSPGEPGPGNRGGGNGGPPPGIVPPDRGGPPPTPPGLGGNPPPGHGGPIPGRGAPGVPRGQNRLCGADGPVAIGPLGQAGASHVAHVSFSPPEDSDSESWARMMYFWIGSSFAYVANAHDLEPESEWTLVARAADESAICLGEATANPGGELHLADSIELDSHLPEDLDPFEPTPEGEDPAGTTLELVPTDAVDCEAGTVSGEADGILTSDHDIRFVDVDEVTCPA